MSDKQKLKGINIMKWKCLKSEYVINDNWLKVRKDTVELPNGTIIKDYYVVEKKSVSLVVAMDNDNRVILTTEHKYPVNALHIGLPGGTFDNENDNPLDVAKRELLEETGYASNHWKSLGVVSEYTTKDTHKVHLFVAKDVYKVAEQKLDITEEIKFEFVPLDKAVTMCINNEIELAAGIVALFKVFYESPLVQPHEIN